LIYLESIITTLSLLMKCGPIKLIKQIDISNNLEKID
jgi:hypothetical protein